MLLACIALLPMLKTDGLAPRTPSPNTPEAITGQQIYDANFDAGGGAPAQILVDTGHADAVIAAAKQVDGINGDEVCVEVDFGKVAALIKERWHRPPLSGNGACAPQQIPGEPGQRADAGGRPAHEQLRLGRRRTTRSSAPRSALDGVDGATHYVGGQTAATPGRARQRRGPTAT